MLDQLARAPYRFWIGAGAVCGIGGLLLGPVFFLLALAGGNVDLIAFGIVTIGVGVIGALVGAGSYVLAGGAPEKLRDRLRAQEVDPDELERALQRADVAGPVYVTEKWVVTGSGNVIALERIEALHFSGQGVNVLLTDNDQIHLALPNGTGDPLAKAIRRRRPAVLAGSDARKLRQVAAEQRR